MDINHKVKKSVRRDPESKDPYIRLLVKVRGGGRDRVRTLYECLCVVCSSTGSWLAVWTLPSIKLF